jgi:hypothetical protein
VNWILLKFLLGPSVQFTFHKYFWSIILGTTVRKMKRNNLPRKKYGDIPGGEDGPHIRAEE